MRSKIPTQGASLNAESMQSHLRGSWADVKLLTNRAQTISGCVQRGNVGIGHVRAMFGWMIFAMLTAISQLKILYAVVELIVVLVVDNFRGRKLSPKMLLHHVAMFTNAPTANRYQAIAIPCESAFPTKFPAKGSFWASIATESEVMGIA